MNTNNRSRSRIKSSTTGILGCILLLGFASMGLCQESLFPNADGAEPNSLVSRRGVYEIGSTSYVADYATLTVSENRSDPTGRKLQLPVIRLHATGKNSGTPVFLLTGGPGSPNVYSSEDLESRGMDAVPYDWLLETHDFVMVGYRGIDGESYLETPLADEAFHVERRPLSRENIEVLAKAMRADFQSIQESGIDIDSYNAVEVANDLEAARIALGYHKVDLYSQSYGTRLAYLFGLSHPNSVHRSVLIGASFPGGFVWELETVEAQLRQYGELWKQDPNSVRLSPDILETMRRVLASLENGRKWLVFDIDVDKVKVMTFNLLYGVETAAQVFDAYVAAEAGDYSGLAYLSVGYGMNKPAGLGDLYSKAVSLDYDPDRDYLAEMEAPGAVLGSPLSRLSWGPTTFDAWPMQQVSSVYRGGQESLVETLVVNGNLDFSTPLSQAKRYLEILPNAQLVVVSNAGHVSDLENLQPEAFRKLVLGFLTSGQSESTFVERPVNFTPTERLTSRAKRYVARYAVMGASPVMLVGVLALWFWRRRRRLATR